MRLTSLVLAGILATASSPASASSISALWVLGDSLSDNGNLSLIVDGAVPGPGPQVPAPPYAPGRASNGPVAAEYLAQFLGLSPLAPAALGGSNYAVVGAATGNVPFPVPGDPGNTADNLAEAIGLTLPVPTGILTGQLPAFLGSLLGPIDPDALFLIWGGPNDLAINPTSGAAAAANVGVAIDALHAAGARRFLVPNSPNLGATPGAIDPVGGALVTLDFNARLAGQLAARSAGLSGIQIIGFDTFALFQSILSNPAAFGFTNTSDACFDGPLLGLGPGTTCPTPETYLFWDGSHPTARAHQLLGQALAATVEEHVVPEPALLALAAMGLMGMAFRRRAA